MLKWSLLDQKKAVEICLPLPDSDLLGVIGSNCCEALKEPMFRLVSKLSKEEQATLLVSIGFAFHAGYSVRLSDEENNGGNLHEQLLNENRATQSAPRS